MAYSKKASYVKKGLSVFLSFLLAVLLFLLSFVIVLEATVFNSSYLLDNMNSSAYFADKCDEIKRSLTDLGYASGLEEEFFEDVVDEVMLHEDTQKYLEDFYSGEGSVVDATAFKQRFNTALDAYIVKKNIDPDSVDGSSREYMISRAAAIYRDSLELPFFKTIAGTFLGIRKAMPYALAVLLVLAVILCVIIIFSQKWKHRAVRYLYYSTASAFLTTAVIPAAVLISGKISQINLSSRAIYNLFVDCGNSIMIALLFCSLFFAVVSVGLYFLYRSLYKKASK